VANRNEQVAQLEAAIAAQGRLRPTLGDAVVDTAVAALREQLASLSGPTGAELTSARALASLQGHLPEELAAKARATPRVEGERKQVTVLFADLAGFTALTESADPEVIRGFQDDLFRELARIIYQHEGFVEKFVGDAILAVFGAPVTHEDDPERALRVALAMRERMAVLNRRWGERLGALTLHVGVNTGTVVAGTIGSSLDPSGAAYAVTGDTVNTAARLQDAAQPGQILVSRTTYRRAQGAFTFRAVEPIQVKGKREPLAAYELVRARLLPGKVRGIQELGPAFVGRQEAFARLRAVTDELTPAPGAGAPHATLGSRGESAGRIVLITGEAGIGKSRLVAEWRASTSGGVQWLEGRCFAHTTTLPYGPFLDMLRRFAGIVDDDTDTRARRRLNAAVERLFPGNAEAVAIAARLLALPLTRKESALLSGVPPRELGDRVMALIEQLFSRLAGERPLVLFLEDMQWVDQTTIEVIEHLLPLTARAPFAVVIAARTDQDPPLDRLRATIEQSYADRLVRLPLVPLDGASTDEMVRRLLGAANLPAGLAADISRRAEGNPFFVEEIIRSLIERGDLKREGDAWVTTVPVAEISVPDTLQGLIMARIDRLPDETKQVVQAAAAIGRTFLYRVLLAMSEHTDSLDADLSHLERRELILQHTREPEVEYAFKHALTQEVAYDSLLTSRRVELHRRVGEALERIFDDRLAEFYPVLADHFAKGEAWSKAVEYHRKAAAHAGQLFAAEADEHYAAAVRTLQQLTPLTRDTRRRLVDATLELCRENLLGRAGTLSETYMRYLQEAEVHEAYLAGVRGEVLRSHKGSALARLIATPTQTPLNRRRLAHVQAWLGRAYYRVGRVTEARDYADAVELLLRELRDGADELDSVPAALAPILLAQGYFDQVEAVVLPTIVNRLERERRWLEWVQANGCLASALAAQGRVREGVARAEVGARRSANLGGQTLVATAHNYLAYALLLGGDYERAAAESERAAEPAQRLHEAHQSYHLGFARSMHAWAWHQLGRPEAMAELDEADRLDFVLRDRRAALRAEHALQTGAAEDAARRAEAVVAAAEQHNDVFALGHAHRTWARALDATGGPQDEIERHFEASVRHFAAGACQVELARTHHTWGSIGLNRRDPRAKDHLARAADIFEHAGLDTEREEVRQLLASV
jgi:class 3 adenylate cyclase